MQIDRAITVRVRFVADPDRKQDRLDDVETAEQ
jgi:hypothetical protein